MRIRNIVREIPFWAHHAVMVVYRPRSTATSPAASQDRDVWPVTYLMLQAVEGNAMLFFIIVATLYAGELIWRERDTTSSRFTTRCPCASGSTGSASSARSP